MGPLRAHSDCHPQVNSSRVREIVPGFHLRHDGEPEPRAASAVERRGRQRADAAGSVQRLPRAQGRLRQSDGQEDSQGRALALRVGQGRLQPEGREPAQGPAAQGPDGFAVARRRLAEVSV